MTIRIMREPGSSAPVDTTALPYYPVRFPRDHAAHHGNVPYEDQLKDLTEWWYFNGKLVSTTGQVYGLFITLFREQIDRVNISCRAIVHLEDVAGQQIYSKMIEFAAKDTHLDTTDLKIEYNNTLGRITLIREDTHTFRIRCETILDQNFKLYLDLRFGQLESKAPLLIKHHKDSQEPGLVPFGPAGKNSYYYSMTRLNTAGRVVLGSDQLDIDKRTSLCWMDHQWGDFLFTDELRWTWLSMQLDNRIEVNGALFPLDESSVGFAWANVLMPTGSDSYVYLSPDIEIKILSTSPNGHPTKLKLDISPLDLSVSMIVQLPFDTDANIWERFCQAEGIYRGQRIAGSGFIENTNSNIP